MQAAGFLCSRTIACHRLQTTDPEAARPQETRKPFKTFNSLVSSGQEHCRYAVERFALLDVALLTPKASRALNVNLQAKS